MMETTEERANKRKMNGVIEWIKDGISTKKYSAYKKEKSGRAVVLLKNNVPIEFDTFSEAMEFGKNQPNRVE